MSSTDTVFAGSIPRMYDRYMVPMLFAPYAREVARRAAAFAPDSILETAAGTGVVTQALHEALPNATIRATDLNEPMLEQASAKLQSPNVQFQYADAQDLPFEAETFDLAVCQFGIMFFPDKVRASAEVHRVLRPGGRYILAIWDSIERNVATRVAGRAVADLFPDDASAFYERVPFRYADQDLIRSDLSEGGFTTIEIETVELRTRAPSAADAAMGLVQGTPMRSEIEKRDPAMLAIATEAAAKALEQFEGKEGLDAPMSALIVTAAK